MNTMQELAAAWIEAKAAETAAVERRRAIDAEIASLMLVKDEGTSSAPFGCFKVSVTNKLTRTLDGEAVREHWNELPELARDAFRWKPELDMKHYRAADFTERDRSFRVIVTGGGMPNGSWQMIAQSVTLFAKRRSRWCETGVAGGPPAVPEGDGLPAGGGWCERWLCSSR